MKPIVYRASMKDAIELAPQLRAEDVEEIRASSGSSPLVALVSGVNNSDPCYSIADEDGVFGMMGVVPTMDSERGVVWMLGSDRVITHAKEFLRQTSLWLDRLHDRYPILWNYVDSRNTTHVRWLEWAGCAFTGQLIVGSVLFLEFNHVRSSSHPSRHRRRLRGPAGVSTRRSGSGS